MTIWHPNISNRAGPRYLAVADCLSEAVRDGALAAGEKLPPQRNLAFDLGVSLNTITRAYAEAERRGLVYGEVGRGTFIRQSGALHRPPFTDKPRPRAETDLIDLTMNLPVVGPGTDELVKFLPDLKSNTDLTELLDYRSAESTARHRQAGAEWISRLGLTLSPDDITVTVGAQQALLVSLMATTRPGDVLLVEHLTYPAILQIAAQLGLKVIAVPMDEFGLRPDKLKTLCENTNARVIYTMPTLHSPTSITLPEDRRLDIAKIARERDLTIIEDDVFGFLPVDRPLPLCAFAPERTLFITSISKSVAPWLRVGYLAAPRFYREAIRSAVHLSCWVPPPLMAEIATRWIEDGTADRLNSWQRQEASDRQQIAARVLNGIPYLADPYGLHLWLPLSSNHHPDLFTAELQRRGVKILPSTAFGASETQQEPAIRLCLGAETTRARIELGLGEIANALSTSSPTPLIV